MKNHYWTWPIACYLFLGGLGGGMLFLTMICDFVFGWGEILSMGVAAAIVALGIGTALLVFELGQPQVFLRVFIGAKTAIIKWGAIMLTIGIFAAIGYYSFFLPFDFIVWRDAAFLKYGCLALAGIIGLGVMIYTGVLLSSLKARAFWNTPALPVLFTVSALSTACAALMFCVGAWPAAVTPLNAVASVLAHELFHTLDIILVMVEIVVLFVYVLIMRGAGNVCATAVAKRWLTGSVAPAFWIGMVLCGLVLPLCLNLLGVSGVASVLVLCSGLLLRFLVIFADDRRTVPGEERFYSRLPKGEEKFLTAWK